MHLLKLCGSDARLCICIFWYFRSLVIYVSKHGGSDTRLCLSVLSDTRLRVSQCLLVFPLASMLLESCDSNAVVCFSKFVGYGTRPCVIQIWWLGVSLSRKVLGPEHFPLYILYIKCSNARSCVFRKPVILTSKLRVSAKFWWLWLVLPIMVVLKLAFVHFAIRLFWQSVMYVSKACVSDAQYLCSEIW